MLIFASVLAVFVYGLMSPMLGVLLPGYALSHAQLGNLGFANALGLMIASLGAGPLIDLKGKKSAVLMGLGLVAMSLACLPNVSSYQTLMAAYFALGIGGGIVTISANSLVAELNPQRRASALNFLNLFFGLGGVVTTYAASYLVMPATLCYSIAALTMLALLMNGATQTSGISKQNFRLSEVPHLLLNPTLILISLMLFLYVACEVGVWNWLKAYLISIHFTPRTAGGIVSYGFAFGMLAGRFVASRVLIRADATKVILAAGVLIAVCTFGMLHVSSRISVTLVVFAAGVAMAPVFPTSLAIAGDQFPRATGTAMGIAITSGWLGLAISSPIVGKAAEAGKLQSALLLLPAFAAALVLVNLVLRSRLRRTAAA